MNPRVFAKCYHPVTGEPWIWCQRCSDLVSVIETSPTVDGTGVTVTVRCHGEVEAHTLPFVVDGVVTLGEAFVQRAQIP